MALLQSKKEAVACEVRLAKELADTSRHCSLRQQIMILELFHFNLIKSHNKRRYDTEAVLSTIGTVDKMDSVEEEAAPFHEPSPLVLLSSVLIDSKIKVGMSFMALLVTSLNIYPLLLPHSLFLTFIVL